MGQHGILVHCVIDRATAMESIARFNPVGRPAPVLWRTSHRSSWPPRWFSVCILRQGGAAEPGP